MALSGDGHRSVESSNVSATSPPLGSCLIVPVVAAASVVASPSVSSHSAPHGQGGDFAGGATKRVCLSVRRGAGTHLLGEQRGTESSLSSPSGIGFQIDSISCNAAIGSIVREGSVPCEIGGVERREMAERRVEQLDAEGSGVQREGIASVPLCTTPGIQSGATMAQGSSGSRCVARKLVMGSSDPHGLQLDDDKAPSCAKRPAFAIASHLPAESTELATRPLPLLNQAEETEPLPPPPALPISPPHVDRVNQVVTPAGLSLVRTWLRRLRRSLRAAQRGELKMAKRLRPKDLWLGEEYMVLEARDWNWDLRPLAVGKPAVPLAPSGRDGVESPSSFERSELGKDDSTFADQAILSEMAQGMRDDSACRRGSLLCAPHGSALENFAVAMEKIAKGVENGWLSSGWELPCWPIRTAPYGVVDESERAGEPKYRFTNDLSWPPAGEMLDDEGVPIDSLNGSMKREDWPANRLMRIYEFSEGVAILGTSGARVEVWGLDVRAYYRAFGRQSGEIWRTAFVDPSGFTLDERCCFGSAADACKCARVSNYLAWQTMKALRAVDEQYPSREPHVLAWQEERRRQGRAAGASEEEIEMRWAALHTFGFYIDDGAGASVADLICLADGSPLMREGKWIRRSQLHFEAAKGVLQRFGLESAPNKEQPPALRIVSLGIELDLEAKRMRVSEDKRKKYAAKAESMAELSSCGREEMVALLSRLQFAASCYPRGRQWLHAPWRAVRAQWRLANGKVLITKAVRRSLQRWACELSSESHEGVPLAARAVLTWGEDVCAVYADASGEKGWMAWTVHKSELLFTEGVWSDAERELPICDKELLASTWGLVTLVPATGASNVMSFTDNTVAQAAMRTLTPTAEAMAHIVQRRSEWLLQWNILESVHRITSKANLWADMGSRGDTGGVLLQALALGLKPRRSEVEEAWQQLATDAVQIRSSDQSVVRVDGKGIVKSPCTSSVADVWDASDFRERDGASGASTQPHDSKASATATDVCVGRSKGRSVEDGSKALVEVQCLRPRLPSDTASGAECADGAKAPSGDAANEFRRLVGVVQAERQVHISRDGEEIRRRSDRMDAKGAFNGLRRRSGNAQTTRSHQGDETRAGRAPQASTMGSSNAAVTRSDGQVSATRVIETGAGMEGGASTGVLHAASRRRGGGAGWRELQPASASDEGRHYSGEVARWVNRAQAALASVEEEGDDREDVHRLPARRREAHRRSKGSTALSRNGSSGSGAGGRNAALQAFERESFPSGRGGADGEVSDGVYRFRSCEVRSSQPEDRRSNGSFSSWDTAHTDQSVGQVEFGHLRDLLPAFAGSGGGNGSIDRFNTVRGCRAGGVCHRGVGSDKLRVSSDAARRPGPRVGRGRCLSTYVVSSRAE